MAQFAKSRAYHNSSGDAGTQRSVRIFYFYFFIAWSKKYKYNTAAAPLYKRKKYKNRSKSGSRYGMMNMMYKLLICKKCMN